MNELPSYKESKVNYTPTNFVSEEVNIKELDYFLPTRFQEPQRL